MAVRPEPYTVREVRVAPRPTREVFGVDRVAVRVELRVGLCLAVAFERLAELRLEPWECDFVVAWLWRPDRFDEPAQHSRAPPQIIRNIIKAANSDFRFAKGLMAAASRWANVNLRSA